MMHSFIMNQTGRVKLPEELRHLIDVPAAVRFIPAGPYQDRRMILIPLIRRVHTVQHHLKPLRPVIWNHLAEIAGHHPRIPGSVGFQVILIHHIDTVLVAEPVDQGRIWIVTGTDRIDIIALHSLQILAKLRFTHMTSAHGAELMAVHALEYDPLPVQSHNVILHLKTPEPNLLRDDLLQYTLRIIDLNPQIIEIRLFRTPKLWFLHCEGISILFPKLLLLPEHCLSGSLKDKYRLPGFGAARYHRLQTDSKRRSLQGLIRHCADLKIPYMHIRHRIEIHIPVDAGEPVEILVLTPA